MGKVDQGVFTYWVLAHQTGRPLQYIGYGGKGKQVRDLIHVDDVVELIDLQLAAPDQWGGRLVNVGGGREISLSLAETTALCRELTGQEVPIGVSRFRPSRRRQDLPHRRVAALRHDGLAAAARRRADARGHRSLGA